MFKLSEVNNFVTNSGAAVWFVCGLIEENSKGDVLQRKVVRGCEVRDI
jgi:hypothetical protein